MTIRDNIKGVFSGFYKEREKLEIGITEDGGGVYRGRLGLTEFYLVSCGKLKGSKINWV